MCQEFIGIALCAPIKKPSISFTCGDLHHIAKERRVCPEAKGTCLCFFGTCGIIKRVMDPAGVDQADVPKIRCSACAIREDNTGERRRGQELIESPLLTRCAVSEEDLPAYMTTIRFFWDGDHCPFHQVAEGVTDSDEKVEISTAANRYNAQGTGPDSIRFDIVNANGGDFQKPKSDTSSSDPPIEYNGPATDDGIKQEPFSPVQPSLDGEAPTQKQEATSESASPRKECFLRLNCPAERALATSAPSHETSLLAPNVGIGTSSWAPGGKLADEPATTALQSSSSDTPVPTNGQRKPSRSAHLTSAARGFLRLN